jgi:uncharacterized protein
MMSTPATATFRFHGGLNDFVQRRQRNTPIEHTFTWRASVKDMLESLGPPHSEVWLLLANGTPVDFDYIVQDGDVIDAYDIASAPRIDNAVALVPPYPGRPRFILDQHLGRTANYLRMLGFDTLYRNDYHDEELAQVSDEDTRILLTRDVGLLKRGRVMYGYFVRNTDPLVSLREIARRFNLGDQVQPFQYCMKCNGHLHAVDKTAIQDQLQPETAAAFEEFHQCESCQQVYWKGAHFAKMEKLVQEVLDDLKS